MVPRHAQRIAFLVIGCCSQNSLPSCFWVTLFSQPLAQSTLWSCHISPSDFLGYGAVFFIFWAAISQAQGWPHQLPCSKAVAVYQEEHSILNYSWGTWPTVWPWWRSLTLMRLSVLALVEKLDVVLPTMGIVISRKFFIKYSKWYMLKKWLVLVYMICNLLIMIVVYWKQNFYFHIFCDLCHSTRLQ